MASPDKKQVLEVTPQLVTSAEREARFVHLLSSFFHEGLLNALKHSQTQEAVYQIGILYRARQLIENTKRTYLKSSNPSEAPLIPAVSGDAIEEPSSDADHQIVFKNRTVIQFVKDLTILFSHALEAVLREATDKEKADFAMDAFGYFSAEYVEKLLTNEASTSADAIVRIPVEPIPPVTVSTTLRPPPPSKLPSVKSAKKPIEERVTVAGPIKENPDLEKVFEAWVDGFDFPPKVKQIVRLFRHFPSGQKLTFDQLGEVGLQVGEISQKETENMASTFRKEYRVLLQNSKQSFQLVEGSGKRQSNGNHKVLTLTLRRLGKA